MKREVLLFSIFLVFKVQTYSDHLRLLNYQDVSNIHRKHSKTSAESSTSDEICNYELQILQRALKNSESWAVKFVDSWAKINAGYLSGNNLNIGDFDSCVRIQHHTVDGGILQGQHCFVTLTALPNSTLVEDRTDLSLKNFANFLRNNGIVATNSFCMPATCSNEKVVEFLNQNYLFKNDLIALGAACRDIHNEKLDAVGYFAIALFSWFVLLMIVSTVYEIIVIKSKNPQPNKLLASFSVYTNGTKLFDMTKIKSPSSLNCLHGLRAMSIFWIILGHRVYNQYPWGNPKDVEKFFVESTFLSSIISAHTIAVDTFFVMGALLMTMSTLRDCEKKQLNILRMIWRRYIRYTPVYAALILFVVAFGNVMLQGPFSADSLRDPCMKNWWLAILHIQNYLHPPDMCLNHGWYLSADFQLFIISPAIIYFIHKYGKLLLAIPVFLCFVTVIYIITISVLYNVQMPSLSASSGYLKYIYYLTYSRAGPWFIGMILGYFLYIHRGKTIKVNKLFNAFMWIVSISIICSIVFLQYAVAIISEPLSQAVHTTFLVFHRNLWAVAVCWIIFACQHLKTGGIVRWFLSWPQWQPISRMGLSMYLIGAVYQVMMILNQRTPLYMNFWHMIPILTSDIVIIVILSTFTYLAFEAPPLIIEDFIYKKIKNKS